MPVDFLKTEETINNLIEELSQIKKANDRINELSIKGEALEKISEKTINSNIELIKLGTDILKKIEGKKLDEKIDSILSQLKENRKLFFVSISLLVIIIIIQILGFIF